LASVINITGIGLAVGCSLVVFIFLDHTYNLDTFQTKLDRLVVLEKIGDKNGHPEYFGDSPFPMGQLLKNENPNIKEFCRLDYKTCVIKAGDNVFKENISFVDTSFYNMFDFPVKWGNKKTFATQDGILLSQEISVKLFGSENPIGKTINLRFAVNGLESNENFIIHGVYDKKPLSASFYFSALLPMQKAILLGIHKEGDWAQNTEITFLEFSNHFVQVPSVAQVKPFVGQYNEVNKESPITGYHFQPLKSMINHSYKLDYSMFSKTHIIGIIMLFLIALFILLLVSFNYMNIAIASAASRMKEIGVRKVMGSSRSNIIIQFMTENLIICTTGVILGLLLAKSIFIPWFTHLVDWNIGEGIFSNPHVWVAIASLIILTVLGGAAYPSFYISALNPVNIAKGSSALGSKNRFRKSLLAFQFLFTFLGLSMSLAFMRENKIASKKSWGYDPLDNMVISLVRPNSYELFSTNLKSDNKVKSITGSVEGFCRWQTPYIVTAEGKDLKINGFSALPGFATHMGIQIVKGRDLNDQFPTDRTEAVLVNQAFKKYSQWDNVIGRNIRIAGKQYTIVGETNDFIYNDFGREVEPLMIKGCNPEEVMFTYVKTDPGLFKNPHVMIESNWKKVFPGLPFDYRYQDNVFNNYFNSFSQVIQILSAASFIMVLVSICGIFGLALLILGKKMKEISIRKVIGANNSTISYQIIKEFLFAILGATLIGCPLSYILTKAFFDTLTPESRVSLLPLGITLAGLLIITFISVSWHMYKAIHANPVKALRSE
ncbi:MAG: FtsX-like permease family protein, partial [Saprospiraceae bacterium]